MLTANFSIYLHVTGDVHTVILYVLIILRAHCPACQECFAFNYIHVYIYIYIYIYISTSEGLLEVDTFVMDLRKRTFSFSLWYLNFRLPAATKTDLTARMLTGQLWRGSAGGRGRGREGEGEGEREGEGEGEMLSSSSRLFKLILTFSEQTQ